MIINIQQTRGSQSVLDPGTASAITISAAVSQSEIPHTINPKRQTQNAANHTEMIETDNNRIKKVLIVDDENLFLESLSEGLADLSDEFVVVTASDGRDALEKLDSEPADLIVTDLKMPVMDGFELLARMQRSHPHLPVIVMTAFGTPDIEKHIQSLDAYDYLEKPIDIQVLADKIRAGIKQITEGHLKGILLASFLQLLQLERKTCLLRITAQEKRGALYFLEGELHDAVYENRHGEAAAYEIVCWEDAEIELVSLSKKVRRRIKKSLSNILMEAAQYLDEAGADNSVPDWTESDAPPTAAVSPKFDRQPTKLLERKPFATAEQGETTAIKSVEKGNFDVHNKQENKEIKNKMANNINQSLEELMFIDGSVAVALVDGNSGMALGTAGGGGVNLEIAAAGNSEVIKSKNKVMKNLGLKDTIEDILITLGQQYHLIRPLSTHQHLFFYVVLNRATSNLAMARFKLTEIESRVEV